MSKIAIWMYQNDDGDYWSDKLIKSLENLGHEVFYAFDMRQCYLKNGEIYSANGINISKMDLLYYMNADERNEYQQDVLRLIELSGTKIINNYDAYFKASDKPTTNLILRQNGINVPNSLLINKDCNASIIKDFFDEFKIVLIKPRIGGGGKGIIKFDNYEQFYDFLGFIKDISTINSLYFEEYIHFNMKDYRVNILNNKIVETYSRVSDSYKTNFHHPLGNVTVENSVISQEIQNMALQSIKALGIQMGIVDVIVDVHGKPYVLEVNELLGMFPLKAEPAWYLEQGEEVLQQLVAFIHRQTGNPE